MDCPACQGDNREGASFCRHCGAPMLGGMAPGALTPEHAPEAAGEPGSSLAAEPAGLPEGEQEAPREPGLIGATAEGELVLEPDVTLPPGEALLEGAGLAEEAELGLEVAGPSGAGDGDAVPPPPAPEMPSPGPGPSEAEAPVSEEEAGAQAPQPEALDAGLEGPTGEAWSLLEPGTVIAGRYLVVEPLETEKGLALYQTRDLCRCSQCGFEDNHPDDRFCAQCGGAMDRSRSVPLLEVPADYEEEQDTEVLARVVGEGRRFLALAPDQAEHEAPAEAQGLVARLLVGQATDAGQIRELNEDGLVSLTLVPSFGSSPVPLLGLYAVADGMGGHEGGEVASQLALQALVRRAIDTIMMPELEGQAASEDELARRLSEAVCVANDAVFLARQKRDNDMGTTLTAALVRGDRAILAHVGDSRAYRWSGRGLEQITTDHSVVARMVASGQIEADEIYTHPHRSVIYRSVGDRPLVDVDTAVVDLGAGDRLVLCSDGLWEMVRTEGIEDVMMQEADPQTACDTLVRRANLAGGEDNISVIVVVMDAA